MSITISAARLPISSNSWLTDVSRGTPYADRISDACAERVREIAREMGYAPNYHVQSMKLDRSEAIAVSLDMGVPDRRRGARVKRLILPPSDGNRVKCRKCPKLAPAVEHPTRGGASKYFLNTREK